ncbi:MAG: YbaN family protein [Pseudomonadota bacterium]
MRLGWIIGGTISLTLGVIGLVLPPLSTTPFIILAAYCYARSSKRMHDWLPEHKVFGPLINDWRRYGAIRRPAKIMATRDARYDVHALRTSFDPSNAAKILRV